MGSHAQSPKFTPQCHTNEAWWCTWEVKERGSEVQDRHWLHSDFQARLSYMSLKETSREGVLLVRWLIR